MADTGEVGKETVLGILRVHGEEVSKEKDDPADMLILAKGDKIEARRIPTNVGRSMIHYLSRKFDIPIHHFYNPDMTPPRPVEKK